jgi:hypothetical protein
MQLSRIIGQITVLRTAGCHYWLLCPGISSFHTDWVNPRHLCTITERVSHFGASVAYEVYEHIIINYIFMFLNIFMLWLKNVHFNNNTGKKRLRRDLQQFIHKVIPRICG